MTRLSVNINKIATLRNARGGNLPDVTKAALDCERFGAQGITVHPRPDQRHIRYSDVLEIRPLIKTEFNIEGNPIPEFRDLVCKVKPDQVTLVPDAPDALTSNAGWNTVSNREFLTEMCRVFKAEGIRVSIFVDPDPDMVRGAALCGADRVELYTEPYAAAMSAITAPEGSPEWQRLCKEAIAPFVRAAQAARALGLGLNAGHDLSLQNLAYFHQQIPWTDEVSIGHALICDALYLGLEETIRRYRVALS